MWTVGLGDAKPSFFLVIEKLQEKIDNMETIFARRTHQQKSVFLYSVSSRGYKEGIVRGTH